MKILAIPRNVDNTWQCQCGTHPAHHNYCNGCNSGPQPSLKDQIMMVIERRVDSADVQGTIEGLAEEITQLAKDQS
jgi:hypothetical protein